MKKRHVKVFLLLFLILSFSSLQKSFSQCSVVIKSTPPSATICTGGTVILYADTAGLCGTVNTYKWDSTDAHIPIVNNNDTLILVLTTSTTQIKYTVTVLCQLDTVVDSVLVTIKQKSVDPDSVSASSNPICNGQSTTLTLNGGGGGDNETIHWYTDSCGGTPGGTGNNLPVTPAVTTTYYGRYEQGAPCSYNTSCSSVTITVKLPSADPVSASASSDTICNGQSTTLILTGGGGGDNETIHWYTDSCGGTSAGTGNNLPVTPAVTTTYYGRYENSAPCNFNTNCDSVTIVVKQKSADPVSATATSDTLCNGQSTTLTLNGGGGGDYETIHWYTDSCGGTPAGTGNNIIVNPGINTIYYGRYEDSLPCNFNTNCAAVTITVTPVAVATPGGTDTLCQSVNPVPFSLAGAGISGSATTGTWSILSGGGTLNTVSSTSQPDTVQYTPAPGFAGTVTLTITTDDPAGPCPLQSATRTIFINPSPDVSFSSLSDTVLCSGGRDSIILISSLSNTTFSWTVSQSNVSGALASSGFVQGPIVDTLFTTPDSLNPGTVIYLVTPKTSACMGATESIVVTVNPFPVKPEATSFGLDSVCAGTHGVSFGVTNPDASNVYHWQTTSGLATIYGDSGMYASIDFITGGIDSVIVTVTGLSGCTGKDTIGIVIKTTSAPDSSRINLYTPGNILVCMNNAFDSYQWGYDDGANQLYPQTLSGETYQDYIAGNSLDTSNRYYWVITTSGNCFTKSYYNRPPMRPEPPVFINSESDLDVVVSSNPSSENFNLNYYGIYVGKINLVMYDVSGRKMFERDAYKEDFVLIQPVELDAICAGIYFGRVLYNQNEQRVFKLMIHH